VAELLEYRALSEFGWTQHDYDEADQVRLGRVMTAISVARALEHSDSGATLSDGESELLGRVLDGQKSSVSGNLGAFATAIRGE